MSVWSSKFSSSNILDTAFKISSGREAKDTAQPERQRGLWNFLTWSFFLATFLTATEVAGGSAHAATTTSDPHDASHAGTDGEQSPSASLNGTTGTALESSPASPQVPESESRLAMNLINPEALPTMAIAASSPLEAAGSHAGSTMSGNVFGTVADNSFDADGGHSGPDASLVTDTQHDVTTVVEHVVDTVTQTVGDLVGETTHVLGDVVADVGHAVGGIVSTLANTADTVLHGVATALADPGDLVANLATVVAGIAHGPLDIIHAAMTDIGISSPGSLTFASATPDHLAIDGSASVGGYSQYNLSVQDLATTGASPVPTDTGGITTLISSALGIGPHHTLPESNSSDHPGDQQTGHLALIDDLSSNNHHGLFG